jgi:hypothetical protein
MFPSRDAGNGRVGFADAPLFRLRVPGEAGGGELRGGYALEPYVLGFVDRAHPTTAELLQDLTV